jgi:hypothetical protein
MCNPGKAHCLKTGALDATPQHTAPRTARTLLLLPSSRDSRAHRVRQVCRKVYNSKP